MWVESNKFRKLCDAGRTLALEESCMSQKHSALVLDDHGSIISSGVNTFNRYEWRGKRHPGFHAEFNALRTLTPRHRKKLSMIILHPSPTLTEFKASKPCDMCLKNLQRWNIYKIYYVDPDTCQWVCQRTRNLSPRGYFTSFVRNNPHLFN